MQALNVLAMFKYGKSNGAVVVRVLLYVMFSNGGGAMFVLNGGDMFMCTVVEASYCLSYVCLFAKCACSLVDDV